ncbi:MAG: hypothetical protein RL571_2897 [Pseudomonadota bacterium]|jgi:putative DNA primase/helicase
MRSNQEAVDLANPDNVDYLAQSPPSTDATSGEDELIAELARLSAIQYERRRAGAAEALDIRAAVLDKLVIAAKKEREASDTGQGNMVLFDVVEPWPEAVRGDEVLTEAYHLLQKYVIADKETLQAAALWCALTWLVDRATVLPIALISAPEKGCGKSVLLEALSHLCFKPLPVASVSAAAMFRAIDKWTPTLFIDEVDTFMRDNPELVGVINSGHTRRNAFVLRTVGDDFEPKAFSTWCPKALSGISAKSLTDSLVSRSIIFNLRRKLKTETVAPLRRDSERYFIDTRSKLMRLAQDIGDTFAVTVPEPFGLDNRAADNWEGLVAIADIAGGVWPLWSRHAAHYIAGAVDTTPSINQELLTDIQAAFEHRKTDKLHTAQLLAELCNDDESSWKTYNRGRELSAKQLCNRLKEFGIKPKQLWISGEGNKRGYELPQLSEAFSRYLVVEAQDVNLKLFSGIPVQKKDETTSNTLITSISAVSPARTLDANNDEVCRGFIHARASDDLEILAEEKTLSPNIHKGSSTLAGASPTSSNARNINTRLQSNEEWLSDLSEAEEF